jgi:hypothetical protein
VNRLSSFRCLQLALALAMFGSHVLAAAPPCSSNRPADPNSFKNPPAPCKMIAWWLWFGPAETTPEVLRELKEMHAAGLGGVLIYPEYPQQVDDPNLSIKNVRFLSPEYLEVYRYAVQAAHNLGMSVDVSGGSGWPYGGPSVSIDLASHAIQMRSYELPNDGFSKKSLLKPDQELVAAFIAQPSQGTPSWRDITSEISAGIQFTPQGEARDKLLIFVSAPTGMKVKRPAWGGEGYVLDHLSSAALLDYTPVLGKLVQKGQSGNLRALFADSLEAYGSDWTSSFLEEFDRRRGYSLLPFLPDIFVNNPARTTDVRFDFWETVADLLTSQYVHPLHEWTRRHGVDLEIQAYGVPAVPQCAYAEVDLPGGEQYDWREFTEGRWASSAAHFYGKKRVLAEYATWAGIPNRFTDTLDDLKLIADLQFLTGMTELSASTLPYSPPSAGIPGWQDYAGAAFGLNQTWWPFFPHLTAYAQRASFILEQGKPVTDVLLYLPVEDVEASARPGSLHTVFGVRDRLAQVKEGDLEEFGLKNALKYEAPLLSAILKSGYTFDGISGDILEHLGVPAGSRIEVGDGSYAVVVLPRIEGMRLGAMQKIADFVGSGGTAIAVGRLPERVYGGLEPATASTRLGAMVEQIFGPSQTESYTVHEFGHGRGIVVQDENDLPRALMEACSPDIWMSNSSTDVGFIHRRARLSVNSNSDYYFIANTSDESKVLHASFRVSHRQPQLWNLESGTTATPATYTFQGDRTALDVLLGPRRSLVVYFGASDQPPVAKSSNLPQATWSHGRVSADVESSGSYFAETTHGRQERVVPPLPGAIEIAAPWRVDFNPRLNVTRTMNQLASWTVDPATRYFSGTAIYSTTFDIPQSCLGVGKLVWLDMGDVRNAARVWVNGHLAGDVWQKPYRLEVRAWLRRGSNQLRIEVANLLINALLGQPPPDYTELKKAYGDRFPYPQEWKANPGPWPSGLLGPVRIVPGMRIEFSVKSEVGAKASGGLR